LGQGVRAAGVSEDDPEVYFGFLSFHRAIQNDITHAKDDASGVALRQAASRHFGITEQDFQAVAPVGASVLGEIASVVREARAYYASELAAGRQPDWSVIRGFENRRLAILRGSAGRLRKAMSPEGWATLQIYVNSTYRKGVIQKEIGHVK
jgi:hypothetical protein